MPRRARSPTALPVGAIEGYVFDGLAVGEHAHAGALRFFATGSLDDEPHGEAMLRRYLESALLTAFATRRLLRAIRFTSAVFTHGIYVPWGVVGEVARQRRRPRVDLERGLSQAALHLQPRRHLSPHAADRAASSTGRTRRCRQRRNRS